MHFNILFFPGFETLDAFGPIEVIGHLPQLYQLAYFSASGGLVASAQAYRIETQPISNLQADGVLLVPGGRGTRQLVADSRFLKALQEAGQKSRYVLGVCTGSVLLAQAGFLDNRRATTNKRAIDWAKQVNPHVLWQDTAR